MVPLSYFLGPLGWFIVLVLGLLVLLNVFAVPWPSSISCVDRSLQFAYTGDSISFTTIAVSFVVVPILVMMLVELLCELQHHLDLATTRCRCKARHKRHCDAVREVWQDKGRHTCQDECKQTGHKGEDTCQNTCQYTCQDTYYQDECEDTSRGTYWKAILGACHRACRRVAGWVGHLLVSGVWMLLLLALLKLLTATPRPHFWDTCGYDLLTTNCSSNGYMDNITLLDCPNYKNNNNTSFRQKVFLLDSAKSFPSGHVSFTMLAALYLSAYLCYRSQRRAAHRDYEALQRCSCSHGSNRTASQRLLQGVDDTVDDTTATSTNNAQDVVNRSHATSSFTNDANNSSDTTSPANDIATTVTNTAAMNTNTIATDTNTIATDTNTFAADTNTSAKDTHNAVMDTLIVATNTNTDTTHTNVAGRGTNVAYTDSKCQSNRRRCAANTASSSRSSRAGKWVEVVVGGVAYWFTLASGVAVVVVGTSRLWDHRHHWWDVVAGGLGGVAAAWFTVVVLCNRFRPRLQPQRRCPHHHRDRVM